MTVLTDLNFFRKSFLEFWPFMDSAIMDFAKDLELPGFPTTKRGILSSTHTAIMNTFSLRAALWAILSPSSMFSRNASWQLLHVEAMYSEYVKQIVDEAENTRLHLPLHSITECVSSIWQLKRCHCLLHKLDLKLVSIQQPSAVTYSHWQDCGQGTRIWNHFLIQEYNKKHIRTDLGCLAAWNQDVLDNNYYNLVQPGQYC